jgi:hypothetical protein
MPRHSKAKSLSRASVMQIRKIIRLERQVWKAAQDRDARAFAELVPADALMIFQSGILTQPQYIATMSGRKLGKNKIADLRGYLPDTKTVILTYKTVRAGSYEGKPFPANPVIESTVWIKRRRRWVAILNQETPISE